MDEIEQQMAELRDAINRPGVPRPRLVAPKVEAEYDLLGEILREYIDRGEVEVIEPGVYRCLTPADRRTTVSGA